MENRKKDSLNKYSYLRPLIVKDILFENTDEIHFLTAGEIIQILEEAYDVKATRQTIYTDIEMLIDAGYDIECVRCRQNKYHVVSRDFDVAELRIIIDVIESSKMLSPERSLKLAKKISRMAGRYGGESLMETVNVAARRKAENNQVYYVVDIVNNAISNKKQLMFKYYEFLADKKRVAKNNDDMYVVSPYRLVWSGEFYYLIAYSEKHSKIVPFRIDRIGGRLEILDEEIVPAPEDFTVADYLTDAFSIRGGEKAQVDLTFHSEVIDALIDRFGDDMSVITQQGGYCTCTVNVTVNNVFFAWIFGFDGKVKIAGPDNVKMEYIKMVSREMARL